MNWYIFTATKNGKSVHEKIPANNKSEAYQTLYCMGYNNIKFEKSSLQSDDIEDEIHQTYVLEYR